nr:MAG TPA: hypothetical protein [Caudoviricetes sp.]
MSLKFLNTSAFILYSFSSLHLISTMTFFPFYNFF